MSNMPAWIYLNTRVLAASTWPRGSLPLVLILTYHIVMLVLFFVTIALVSKIYCINILLHCLIPTLSYIY